MCTIVHHLANNILYYMMYTYVHNEKLENHHSVCMGQCDIIIRTSNYNKSSQMAVIHGTYMTFITCMFCDPVYMHKYSRKCSKRDGLSCCKSSPCRNGSAGPKTAENGCHNGSVIVTKSLPSPDIRCCGGS